ncbi:unnamed protein product [Prorocentrum cordatum]|uniref:Transmembrane 9 superfamily member n=1 Tax=Prorocentrum cordatum TaxID=2364126 RepID=A0ABN9TGA9_9DINO|nr:unnamed protein product [Polarella glacialis]
MNAPHGDTDHLQSYSASRNAFFEEISMPNQSGAMVEFQYMHSGMQETVYINQVESNFLNFGNSLLSLSLIFGFLANSCFQNDVPVGANGSPLPPTTRRWRFRSCSSRESNREGKEFKPCERDPLLP